MENAVNKSQKKNNMIIGFAAVTVLLASVFILYAYYSGRSEQIAPAKEAEERVLQKWGKTLNELPAVDLTVISPHNTDICLIFQHSFKDFYAFEYGKKINFHWHEGALIRGSNEMLSILTEMDKMQEPANIDIIFGGGQYVYDQLAENGLLKPLVLDKETLANIPQNFNGVAYRDDELMWCGNALSGFGIIYNINMLEEAGVAEPKSWSDLAEERYFEHIILADPSKSGSTAAIFDLIVNNGPDWSNGWATLLSILSNSTRIVNSSTTAANAPSNGEAAVSVCIDFYGYARQQIRPGSIKYITPERGTIYTPDPIAIHRDSQNFELAQEFINFVLSCQGQSLWALPADNLQKSTVDNTLFRTPIRKNFYDKNAGSLPEWLENPYTKSTHTGDVNKTAAVHAVLIELVKAAAIDNYDLMKAARKVLIKSGSAGNLLKIFGKLPENVNTWEKAGKMAEKFKDEQTKEQTTAQWRAFFKSNFIKVIEGV